jgi:tellurite resistance protein TehA-like permease
MDAPPKTRIDVSQLPPNIFAIVMATGIVSIAANRAGLSIVAYALFALNSVAYVILLALVALRLARHWSLVASDLVNHAKAPGFFTMVAGPCVLGNQFVLLVDQPAIAATLLAIGFGFWLVLSYLMLPALIGAKEKPPPERGLSGAWLLVVVGTQAISVSLSLLAPRFASLSESALFAALAFWLAGGMIYLWIISQIFHRILFLPLAAGDLTPPYWINMGAMAIATLAGARLVGASNHSPLLEELLPFLKGMTLLFWSTATWWIPVLLVLGAWRHVSQHVPLAYDHGYWAMVFPLGMYTACTYAIADVLRLSYLAALQDVFVWLALAAWAAAAAGLVRRVVAAVVAPGTPPRVT